MLAIPKFKDHELVRADNRDVIIRPTNQQIYAQNNFVVHNWEYNSQEFKKLLRYLACPFKKNNIITRIQDQPNLDEVESHLSNDQYVLMQLFCENRYSYKGVTSWMLLANTNHCFLIDALKYRQQIKNLRNIFESPKIVKLAFDYQNSISYLKRDFQIFPINLFDLGAPEYFDQALSAKGVRDRAEMQRQLLEKPETILQRPLRDQSFEIIKKSFNLLIEYSSKMLPRVSINSPSEQLGVEYMMEYYKNINQPDHILECYQHKPMQALPQQKIFDLNPKKRHLYELLIRFRQHVGKMNDISVQIILPKDVITQILEHCKISVLQISQLYSDRNYSRVGLELCKRIYDVIQLHEELYENQQRLKVQLFEKQLNKVSSKKQINQPFNIKKLLKDIQWGDGSEWLNRRDDPSLKLYKQIISIDEFDYSIGEQYIKQMKGDVIKKKDIGKFLKYAQYMRNKNYDSLKELYQRSQKLKQNVKDDQFSEETQFQTKQEKGGEKFGRKLFAEQQTQIKSSTSLDQRIAEQSEQNVQQRIRSVPTKNQSMTSIHNIEESEENVRSRKSSETSLININQIDDITIKRSDIKPLPNSIQQIYQMALQVKKKADKKVNKKKQKKSKNQGNKEMDFIPTWSDIQKLLNSAHNLK